MGLDIYIKLAVLVLDASPAHWLLTGCVPTHHKCQTTLCSSMAEQLIVNQPVAASKPAKVIAVSTAPGKGFH